MLKNSFLFTAVDILSKVFVSLNNCKPSLMFVSDSMGKYLTRLKTKVKYNCVGLIHLLMKNKSFLTLTLGLNIIKFLSSSLIP
jgi:hypothetical protein